MKSKIKRFQIIGLNEYRDFDISFEEPCKILVGENGLGKTTIINVFYYVLTRRWVSLDKIQFDFIDLVIGEDVIEFSQSELRMYVSHIIQDDGFVDKDAVEKFHLIDKILKANITNVIYFPIFRNLDQFLLELFDTSTFHFINKRKYINNETKDFVVDNLVFSAKEIQDLLDQFSKTDVLRNFKNLCNKYLIETRFDIDDQSNSFVINKNNNQKVAISDLSSGEIQIINFFARTYLNNGKDLIILIDEPEVSLSIKWQKSLLQDILKADNCSLMFVITHSPFTFNNGLDKYAVPMRLYTKIEYEN